MPEFPEPLGAPNSLEGLMARAYESAEDEAEVREHLEAVREAEATDGEGPVQEPVIPVDAPDEE